MLDGVRPIVVTFHKPVLNFWETAWDAAETWRNTIRPLHIEKLWDFNCNESMLLRHAPKVMARRFNEGFLLFGDFSLGVHISGHDTDNGVLNGLLIQADGKYSTDHVAPASEWMKQEDDIMLHPIPVHIAKSWIENPLRPPIAPKASYDDWGSFYLDQNLDKPIPHWLELETVDPEVWQPDSPIQDKAALS